MRESLIPTAPEVITTSTPTPLLGKLQRFVLEGHATQAVVCREGLQHSLRSKTRIILGLHISLVASRCLPIPRPSRRFATPSYDPLSQNFPQGWPKFAQSAVLWDQMGEAIVVASLLPLHATIEQAGALVRIDTAYPFGDTAHITVTAQRQVQLKIRIPGWAHNATVNGGKAANGTLVSLSCGSGNTSIVVELNPQVVVEEGWGDTLKDPPTNALAIVRGPLVFAQQLVENRTVVRTYSTTPASVGRHAPDYLISTNSTWNLALELGAAGFTFDSKPSANWSLQWPFDDSGEYPFSITAGARVLHSWGYWRGDP